MKKTLQEKEGFTLLITIIGLALMTTLGFAILTSTTNNFKATDTDSKNQSAYYIAEAGINYAIDNINTLMESTNEVSSSAFFSSLNTKIDALPRTIYFDENFGVVPNATVNITPIENNEDTKVYSIEANGVIGESKRTLTSTISITWGETIVTQTNSEVVININKLTFKGPALNAPGKTIVIKKQENDSLGGNTQIIAKNIYIEDLNNDELKGVLFGDKKDPGNIYIKGNLTKTAGDLVIYGDLHVKGNVKIAGSVKINGNLYVDGALEVSGSAHINGNVYVNGEGKILNSGKITGNLTVHKELSLSGNANIIGNIYVDGNLYMASSSVNGIIKTLGNLNITGNPTIVGSMFYKGNLTTTTDIKNSNPGKFIEDKNIVNVDKIRVKIDTPGACKVEFKKKSDYETDGFIIKDGDDYNKIKSGEKWYVKKYERSNGFNEDLLDVVIISEEDIILGNYKNFRGVLISRNGKIKYTGSGNFNGVLIAKEEISIEGNTVANIMALEEYFTKNDIPVSVKCKASGDTSIDDSEIIESKKNEIRIIKKMKEK